MHAASKNRFMYGFVEFDGYKDSESRAQSQNGFCGLPGRISSNTGPKIVHIGGKNELFFAYSEIPSYLCAPVRNAGKCGKID